MADRRAVLEAAIARRKEYLVNLNALDDYEAIRRFEAELALLDAGGASISQIPGLADVDEELQDYWLSKLGGDFTNTGNPEPAKSLVQWREVARTGTYLPARNTLTPNGDPTRYSISANDAAIGLAWAEAYAKESGVTDAQIAAAEAELAATYGL